VLQSATYRTERGPDDSILADLGGTQVAIPQICAQMVQHVRDVAEQRLGTRLERAVFTVPVSYGTGERAAITAMARVAGIEIAGLLEEPVAAAMAYGFGKGKNEIVAVYDFGGGTFDFTVIDIHGYSFRILARGGDPWLGGDDFDAALANAVANAVWRATGVELHNRAVEWQRLLLACEAAKRELSHTQQTTIDVPRLLESPRVLNLRQPLDRGTLERLCGSLLERSLAICEGALSRAGLDPADVHQVIATGGVSHIPFVRAGLSRYFARPIHDQVSPDEAICLGAGFRAAQFARQPVDGIADRLPDLG